MKFAGDKCGMLTTAEAEKILGMSKGLLQYRRAKNEGPAYIKDGAKIWYPTQWVIDWGSLPDLATRNPLPDNNPWETYFARVGDFIKIGRSKQLDKRISSLQSGNALPVEVLKVTQSIEEKEAHLKFHHLKISGEWFIPGPDLLSFIDGL